MRYGPGGGWKRDRNRSLEDRLLAMSEPEPNTNCRLWIGASNGVGYGVLTHKGKRLYAHVAAWVLKNGSVPTGKELDHKCRVRCCINEDHLEPVSRRENLRRGSTLVGMFHRGEYVPRAADGTFAKRNA